MAAITIQDADLAGLMDKVVIVTGGSSGIGLATVQLLASLGASVINGDISPPAAADSESSAGTVMFVKTDVSDWKQLTALFKKAREQHGRIDHVFCNAGLGPRADYLSTELDADGDLKEPSSALYDVSLKGVVNTATLAIYHLRQQQPAGGSIVINASTMGIQRCRGVDYAAAKHAVLGFARGLYPLLGPTAANLPIRINSVCPTWTESSVLPGLRAIMDGIGVEIQPPSAVARAAALLMADASRNGQAVHVQQGRFQEIDEAMLLPAADRIRGPDYPAEDDVLRRALEFVAGMQAK